MRAVLTHCAVTGRLRSATVIERFMGEREDGPRGPGAGWATTTKKHTKPLIEKLRSNLGDRPIAQIRHAELLDFLGTHTNTTQKSS